MANNINPIIPLSYNLADGKKKYVLFCGAGISKDAGIPTGWDILIETLRLIRNQEDGEIKEYSNEDMEVYYEDNYKGATYSEIIEKLFPSIEEQRAFLKKQFEGKTPGKAHREFLLTSIFLSPPHKCLSLTQFSPLFPHFRPIQPHISQLSPTFNDSYR